MVCGDRDTGRLMVEHPTPPMASITGSVRAGIQVAGSAAKDVKRVHLELGGKAPVVVFDDADLPAAVEGIPEAASSTPDRTAPRPPACSCTSPCTTSSSPRWPRRPREVKTGDPSDEDCSTVR